MICSPRAPRRDFEDGVENSEIAVARLNGDINNIGAKDIGPGCCGRGARNFERSQAFGRSKTLMHDVAIFEVG